MAAPTQIFVDPSIAGDSGTGSVGDPYGDLQYALDQTTPNGTNGDQFNVKAGTDEVLTAALDLTGYGGSPDISIPLIFRGYTSAADDGGIGGISGNGSVAVWDIDNDGIHFLDMHIHNCGSADVFNNPNGQYCRIINCEIDNTSGGGLIFGSIGGNAVVAGCNIHNIGGRGIQFDSASRAFYNYLANGTNDFTDAIFLVDTGSTAAFNIISLDGSSSGIASSNTNETIFGNSILSSSGTGKGIYIDAASGAPLMVVVSNVIEGFSGAGGVAMDLNEGTVTRNHGLYGRNAFYNNTTNEDLPAGEILYNDGDNESLGSSPFAKSGSDTFANRFTYFEPNDVGNVQGGAYPTGSRRDKGAVQHTDPAGGAGGLLVHPGMTGGIRG